MNKDSPTFEDLIQIVQLIESSSRFRELHLKVGDIEIDLRAKINGEDRDVARLEPAAPVVTRAGKAFEAIDIAPVETAQSTTCAPEFPQGSMIVRSPTVGTFYRAPEPGAKPFVEVGSRVKPETTVCIIEVMKLMNSIPAERSGVVTHILVDDSQLVQADQALVVIDPDA